MFLLTDIVTKNAALGKSKKKAHRPQRCALAFTFLFTRLDLFAYEHRRHGDDRDQGSAAAHAADDGVALIDVAHVDKVVVRLDILFVIRILPDLDALDIKIVAAVLALVADLARAIKTA